MNFDIIFLNVIIKYKIFAANFRSLIDGKCKLLSHYFFLDSITAVESAGAIIAPSYSSYGYGAFPGLLAHGSGLQGQYIPDSNELLFDDGSYKPNLYEQ